MALSASFQGDERQAAEPELVERLGLEEPDSVLEEEEYVRMVAKGGEPATLLMAVLVEEVEMVQLVDQFQGMVMGVDIALILTVQIMDEAVVVQYQLLEQLKLEQRKD